MRKGVRSGVAAGRTSSIILLLGGREGCGGAGFAGGWRGWRAGCLILFVILAVITTTTTVSATRIIGVDPPTTNVSDIEGTTRSFNIRIDTVSNGTWYVDSILRQSNLSEGDMTLTEPAVPGSHNITVVVTGTDGETDLREWNWTVTDTTPPSINNVTLNTTSLYTGQPILVTVNATDSVGVTNVSANGTLLSAMGGNIWQGTITALKGTHAVNVSASDAAGNAAWNNSTSYTASNAIVASIDKSVYLPGENITLTGRVYSDYGDGEARIVVLNSSADSVYDNVVNVTGGSMLEIFGAPLDAGDYRLAVSFVDMSIAIDFNIDATPPASVTGLTNVSYAQTYINWTWTDPSDADFSKVMVYLNGSFQTNVTNGTQYYNATGLAANTEYPKFPTF